MPVPTKTDDEANIHKYVGGDMTGFISLLNRDGYADSP